MQFILFQRFYFYFLSHSPRIPLAYFYSALARPPDSERYKYGIYGYNYKDLLGLGGRGAEREEVAGLMQLQAAGYDMFISVCVSFLMIFNYARDSYFTRAIKRSILYSAFRCRQQHAAPRPSGRSGNTGNTGNSGKWNGLLAGIGLHTKRRKA